MRTGHPARARDVPHCAPVLHGPRRGHRLFAAAQLLKLYCVFEVKHVNLHCVVTIKCGLQVATLEEVKANKGRKVRRSVWRDK